MKELTELRKNPPEGIRVITSDENMLDVTGIIEGPEGTPYAGGYFKVKFKFTEEFPASPPKCWFATKIFHPNVSGAGEICVNTLKKDWKSEYGIGHILITVKCLLIYPNPESALDEEAGKLLLENYESYCDRAKLITSVHATPRTKPAEFLNPSKSESSAASASSSAVPSSSKLPPSTESSTPTLSIASHLPPRKSPAPPSPTQSKLTLKDSSELKDGAGVVKERHASPSPLGTANANVGGGNGTGAPAVVGMGAGPSPMKKAVKRAATGGAATGAEKRKKALKRL